MNNLPFVFRQLRKNRGFTAGAVLLVAIGLILIGVWLWMRTPSKRAFAFSKALNEGRFAQAATMVDPNQQWPGDWANPAKWSEFEKVTCKSYVAGYGFPPHFPFIRRRERWVHANTVLEHNGVAALHSHIFLVTATSIARKPWHPTDVLGSRVSLEEEPKAEKEQEKVPDDIADVPALDLRAGGDEKKRYFLIGLREDRSLPARSYKLLVVIPGGDGSAGFSYFVRRIYRNALSDDWLIAQMVAPVWDAKQRRTLVWPRAAQPYPTATFTTEEFFDAVIADVQSRAKLDSAGVHMLAWSSGGPPAYAIALREEPAVSGAFIAMSVFLSEELQPLSRASGKTFFLLQSPDDQITKYSHAERAEAALKAAGAKVRFRSYAGGHGWRGDVWKFVREGVRCLEHKPEP